MTTARDIMNPGALCVDEDRTLADAAAMMAEEDVGALPICGSDGKLKGIVTDRDIVVKCVAAGGDPATAKVADLASGEVAWIACDADSTEVVRVMRDRNIRRVPVIEEKRMVGMISEADLATHLNDDELTAYLHDVYSSAPNN